jgi:hypothetical protein
MAVVAAAVATAAEEIEAAAAASEGAAANRAEFGGREASLAREAAEDVAERHLKTMCNRICFFLNRKKIVKNPRPTGFQ